MIQYYCCSAVFSSGTQGKRGQLKARSNRDVKSKRTQRRVPAAVLSSVLSPRPLPEPHGYIFRHVLLLPYGFKVLCKNLIMDW